MLKRFIQLFFVVVGAALGYHYGPSLIQFLNVTVNFGLENPYINPYIGAFGGAVLLFFSTSYLTDWLVDRLRRGEERLIKEVPVVDVLFGVIGMVIGLIVAFLLFLPLQSIPILGNFLPLFVSGLLATSGTASGFPSATKSSPFSRWDACRGKRPRTRSRRARTRFSTRA